MIRSILATAILGLLATPAFAAPSCIRGGEPGLKIHLSIGVGGGYTEAEQEVFDKMTLRQHGIEADTVERTSMGCMKITRFEGGKWTTEYYDPETFEQKPLKLTIPQAY